MYNFGKLCPVIMLATLAVPALAQKIAPIYKVDSVGVHLEKSNPPNLVVNAKGLVTSSGWKNGTLLPVIYIQPPPDGIYDFDFVATPPMGAVLYVISPIEAMGSMKGIGPNVKGVRIHSQTNTLTRMLSKYDAKEGVPAPGNNTEMICGGVVGASCPEGQYCDYSMGTAGICRLAPKFCPEIYKPVCGQDGKTYANDCFAAAKGISVAYEGECLLSSRPIQRCEVGDAKSCQKGEFCQAFAGQSCKGPGACASTPDICPRTYDPVCGCDDATHSNACAARAVGVNVKHDGECNKAP